MIVLFDLCGEFWRNFYGTGCSEMATYETTIERLMFYRDEHEKFAVCLDSRSKRHDIFPEYKANRKPKPPLAIETLRSVETQVCSWSIPAIRCDGYEADDIIATLVSQAWADEVRIVGGSPDKDLWALISDTVKVITKRGEVGPEGCVDKFGVQPEQMRDLLAMVGDVTDNVPGCPNCGMDRARTILKAFGTLNTAKAASDADLLKLYGVGEKTVESFRAWDPALAVSLVTLMTDAPVKLEELWPTD